MPNHILKTPTGIRGLDEVLNGGVPSGGLTLLSGGPGTGKTLFGLEFIVRGALNGRPGILLTFEEREQALHRYASMFGWDTVALEQQGMLALIGARFDPDAILSGDFDLGSILAILRHKTAAMQSKQLVIDAPDVFLRLLDNRSKERTELYRLQNWLRDNNQTAVMTVKVHEDDLSNSYREFLDYMADCVIQLDERVNEQVTTRRIRVVKYRGSVHGRNEYPFALTNQGVWIIPVTATSLTHTGLGEPVSSGVAGLDVLLGGGYRRGSCTLIAGTSGTGKTTFAATFTRNATANGERVFYLNFEESIDAMLSCMLSPGIDLRPALNSGNLNFVSVMPESQGIEEHLIQAFKIIEQFQPSLIVVDAISACRRMGSEHAAFDYLLRLVDHCKGMGITTVLTNLTSNTRETLEITGMDLSSMIDTVIILRNAEHGGQYIRELAILKSRGQSHSNKVHKFSLSAQGIEVLGLNAGSRNEK